MRFAHVLWLGNLLGVISIGYTLAGVATRRHSDLMACRERALSPLEALPSASDIAAAMHPHILAVAELDDDDRLLTVLRNLEHVTASERIRHKRVCEQAVKALNTFAEHIDAGLFFVRREVRADPERHLELIRTTALLEPFIWGESLVHGRGRWGYRVLQLRQLVMTLRLESADPAVRGVITVDYAGQEVVVAEAVGRGGRFWRLLRHPAHPTTITTRTKLHQKKRQRALSMKLRGAPSGAQLATAPTVVW